MNVFPVRARAADGGLQLAIADQVRSPLPSTGIRRPDERARQAGVRPEAFALADGTAAPVLAATVEHVEYLGHETLAHVVVGTASATVRLVARLPGMQPLSKDEPVRLAFDPKRLHLFDEKRRGALDSVRGPPKGGPYARCL